MILYTSKKKSEVATVFDRICNKYLLFYTQIYYGNLQNSCILS